MLSGTYFFSLSIVCIRKLEKQKTLHCYLLTTVQVLVGMAMAGVWTTIESAWGLPSTWLNACFFAGFGFVGILQVIFKTKALASEETKNVATALTLSIVLSYALQLTVFEEELDWVSICGAIIIVFCVVLSARWENAMEVLDRCTCYFQTLDD